MGQSATVEVTESFDVPAEPSVVWALLRDPATVVGCLPGAELREQRADGVIGGAMTIKLGPTVVTFAGEVTPTFDDESRTGSLAATGADKGGRTRASATTAFRVTPATGPGASTVAVEARIDVSGGLATFVRSGGTHLATRMLADFAAAVRERCTAPAPEPVPVASEGPAAPTVPASKPIPTRPVSGLRLLVLTAGDVVWGWITAASAAWRRRGTATTKADQP